jgi:hypothetical protein
MPLVCWKTKVAIGYLSDATKGLKPRSVQGPGGSNHRSSGSIGWAAVQLGQTLWGDRDAACSGASVELVKSLGANNVVDYRRE